MWAKYQSDNNEIEKEINSEFQKHLADSSRPFDIKMQSSTEIYERNGIEQCDTKITRGTIYCSPDQAQRIESLFWNKDNVF